MTYYRIDDGDGNELCDGLHAYQVWDAAQRLADRIGRSVYVSGPDADNEEVCTSEDASADAEIESRLDDLESKVRISRLRTEAERAGDAEQVRLCTEALSGDVAARVECERVIAEAAARALKD